MLNHLANYISDYLNHDADERVNGEPTARTITEALEAYESVHDKTVTFTNCQTDETDETDKTVGGQVYEDLRTALEGVVKAYNSDIDVFVSGLVIMQELFSSNTVAPISMVEYETRLQYVKAKAEMAEAMEYADNVLNDLSHHETLCQTIEADRRFKEYDLLNHQVRQS